MGFCANTTCGQSYMKWHALKQMNKKGIYMPDQIMNACDKYWDKFNPEDEMVVNKQKCTEMVEAAVNELGSIGDGQKFDED